MLTQFDSELYPNDCEVVEMLSRNQFVYLIQKNGSSSIRREVQDNNLTVYRNEDIIKLDTVDVYIRDPMKRYISGVNTYIQHLQRDNPELDTNTCLWFATRYNFLNRHYLPQFHWLVNLSRFLNPDAQIRLRNFEDLGHITKHNKDAGITKPSDEFVQQVINNADKDIQLWWFVDQLLKNLSGENLTFRQIVEQLQTNEVYNIITQRFKEVAKTLLP